MRDITGSKLSGTITPPSSKSMTHRALILAANSEPGTRIYNVLESEDTNATKEGLERMGAKFSPVANGLELQQRIDKGTRVINCKNSGTTLRLLTGVASLYPHETTLMGDDSLLKRPMEPLVSALQQLGARITSLDGFPPITIQEPIKDFATECDIAGNVSSQFVSSLLILGSLRNQGLKTRLDLIPPVVSKPYLKLTQEMINNIGGDVADKENHFEVIGQGYFSKFDMSIENDFSSAAFFIVAGAFPGNKITISGLTHKYHQADSQIIDFVKEAGAVVKEQGDGITIIGNDLSAFEVDISHCPDLFPILCVLAAAAEGQSTIYGAGHLKHKESDRIRAMQYNFDQAGITYEAREDGAVITAGLPQGNVEFNSLGDHRIAMACAILGTIGVGTVKIRNWECVNVSYPNFFTDLDRVTKY